MKGAIVTARNLILGGLALAATICLCPGISRADTLTFVSQPDANDVIFFDATTGVTYDISTATYSTFAAGAAVLESTPWWNNLGLAANFADAVEGDLGYPNGGTTGPFFQFTDPQSGNFSWAADANCVACGAILSDASAFASPVYATATVVGTPEPGTLSMFFSGLLGLSLVVGAKRALGTHPTTEG